ncbi:LURP-one-related/scramblase family protein [Allonocardiopsis opalescens]|uniref:Uncharacterized protein YxjI n=1 Tax=Allonocardiopsis opalescens TaxID=1144618 RepID=A0A2T0PU82_9ACTN|nr:LURP-one-related family protein [Allonocardiopsis opalescens]PRX92457.1 uncharacterized protein YxjI [Allonocardiopsis opalescens]
MRFVVRERIFDIGDDYWIEDERGERVFLVDGKALRIRDTFELKDRDDRVVATIKAKLLSLRGTMTIERGGETVATVKKKLFSPLRERLDVEFPDGREWEVSGDLLHKEYLIEGDGRPVAEISHKWFRVRDTYGVDVRDATVDPALVLAVAVAVDSLTDDEDDD